MSAALHPGCDRTIAHAALPGGADATPTATAHPRLVLATTILASSLAFIDGSIVNVGLPAIGRSLAADGGGLSWVVNGYLLPLSALLLIGGAAGDRWGRRRLLLIGVGGFALASVLCSAAPSLAWLTGGRVLQGAAAALLMPNSLAILGASFSGEARGRAIGTWAAVGAGAGAVGPLLGGWLIDALGWRAMFVVNLPVAAAAFALAAYGLHDDVRDAAARPPLDAAGAALATAALACLTWGLTAGSGAAGWTAPASTALAAGAVFGGLFIAVERQRRASAMLPLALFGSPRFVGLTLLTFSLYGALGGLMVLVPYVLIDAAGYSATAAGAALLPLPLVIALSAPTMGRIAARLGARTPLVVGPVVVAAGCALATRIGGDGANYWTTTLPAVLLIAIGMAGVVAPLTTAVLSSVDARQTGVASGFNSAVARSGGLIATALLGGVLTLHGAALHGGFRWAALLCAGAALAGALSAFVGLRAAAPTQPALR